MIATNRLRTVFQVVCFIYFFLASVVFFIRSPHAPKVTHLSPYFRKLLTRTQPTKSSLQSFEPSKNRKEIESPRVEYDHPFPVKFPLRNESLPPLVIGFSMTGGVGNQISNILEALYLVRRIGATLTFPTVMPRADVENSTVISSIRLGSRVWDLDKFKAAMRGRPVYPYLPPECHNKIDRVYAFVRGQQRLPPVDELPKGVRQTACILLRARPNGPKLCPDDMFQDVNILPRRQNITQYGDQRFMRELASISGPSHPSKRPEDAVCVWISGHYYDLQDEKVLYSQMHFLDAAPRIAKLAYGWPLSTMGVVHIRYDEHKCDKHGLIFKENIGKKVCVSLNAFGGRNQDAVTWTPITVYVSVIGDTLLKAGVTSIYIAASPYVPEETVIRLRREFSDLLKVEKFANARVLDVDLMDINFLERELGIQSKVFIGDYQSSWTNTVYWKRRTLGKTSMWANQILRAGPSIGKFADDTPIDFPDLPAR